MIKINKVNNSLTVEGVDNVFYPNNGDNSYPLNSLIVVIDDSNMATFRSVATNDVLFSGLIEDITINGEAVTKDNIIAKFDAVSNSSTGGGGGGTVDAYTKEEADNKFATKTELTNVQTVANDADTKVDALTPRVEGVETEMNDKQDLLVSGTNIKTINNQSILGEGNIEITGGDVDLTNYYTKTEADEIFATTTEVRHQAADISALQTDMRGKQATLVSGENIKTINSESILGTGDIQINGVSEEQAQEIAKIPTIETELAQKANVSDVPTVQHGRNGTNKNYVYSYADISNKNNDKVLSHCTFLKVSPNRLELAFIYWGDEGYRLQIPIPLATPSNAGIMSGADKTKLDSIPETIPSQSEIDGIAANVSALQTAMDGKQPTLVSGTNIKTINGESVLGEGNLVIEGEGIDLSNYYNKTEVDTKLDTKQNTLVSGTNIKTINSQSIIGEGNIEVTIPDATTSTSGAMSAADKTKLDSISNEWTGTQSEFDALTTKDDNIIYYVTE